ncbi:MAG: phenylalanine--tRNA ligase subunit alpha [Candidatus Abawacabacteria bacterium]|nr:phenylalanine--tRNA ligase subunit alpha [Candidatus Abawacabacteria bacterium]
MNIDVIQQQVNELAELINKVQNFSELTEIKRKYIGKDGLLDAQFKQWLQNSSPEEKKQFGSQLQSLRNQAYTLFQDKEEQIKIQELVAQESKEAIDVTLPSKSLGGSLHPLTQVQYELIDIFRSLGFAVLRGPEAEFEYYNFEALNIPATHPARDMQDTFFLSGEHKVMRTHTSSVQVRAMEQYGAPLRIIVPGRVFRNEALDASHEHTFYQLEGMMIDENLTIGNLLAVMKLLLREMFGREINVRLRPGYFPFVEPGFELDAECAICGGKGCSVCKHSGWVELIPCGMIHPKVLEYGKIDSTKYNGWAFGMGLSRLVMMKYKIDDIRLMQSGDLRFLSQFSL